MKKPYSCVFCSCSTDGKYRIFRTLVVKSSMNNKWRRKRFSRNVKMAASFCQLHTLRKSLFSSCYVRNVTFLLSKISSFYVRIGRILSMKMRSKSVNKIELIIRNTFINIEIDCKQAISRYCNKDGKFELFVFNLSWIVEYCGSIGFNWLIYWFQLLWWMFQVDSLSLSTIELAGKNLLELDWNRGLKMMRLDWCVLLHCRTRTLTVL